MQFDLNAWIRAETEQCISLAKEHEGWHDYVKAKADKLAERSPQLFGHLPKVVRQAIAEALNA